MDNVIPAAGRFAEKAKEEQRVNMFVVHRHPVEVVDYLEGALSYHSEIIKQGHPEQFWVTGIIHSPILLSKDGYTDPVKVIEVGSGYSRMADCISEYGNDQGLLNFITNGAIGLHLMVLGGSYENPSLPTDGNIVTVGPRKIQDPDHEGREPFWIDNPESYQCHWGDLEGFLLGEVLGQCCCGSPRDVIRFVFDTIEHLGMPYDDDKVHKAGSGPRWLNRKAAEAKYGDGPLYFVWHNLEALDLTEHGGCAPGWLTGEGEHFLALLKIEIGDKPDEYASGR